jgi:hypothetical protein
MRFTGTKGTALFVLLILIAAGLGFGSGLLVGRQFPAHHWRQIEGTAYLYDSSTGQPCSALKNPRESSNLFDQAAGAPAAKSPGYPPPCGK